MRTGKIYVTWLLSTIFLLLGGINMVAQTYKKTFSFEFSRESFPVKKDQNGWDYIQPDSSLYNFSLGSDTLKPELPFINYKILLPDNYKVKTISSFSEEEFYYDQGIILRPNAMGTSVSTTYNNEDRHVTYPFAIHSAEAICTSEEIVDGYRIGNFSIMPFYYDVEDKMLNISVMFELRVIIEPVEETEKIEHKGEMTETFKSLIYNHEDIGKNTDNWTIIENPSTQCTVGYIPINGWDKIEHRYTKDWNIRFAASQTLTEKVQMGILINKDSIHNGITYQVIERKKNGQVTDSLLYRQEGDRVYRYSETEKKDILLFDFGLNEGDEFITPNGEVWTVDKVKQTAQYNDWTEKTITLKGKEDGEIKDVWLEHVGSLYTGILTYDDIGGRGSLPQLAYCRQGDASPWLFDVNTEHLKIVYFYHLDSDEEYNFTQSLPSEEAAYFDQYGEDDYLYANLEGNTLRIYGKMDMNCYNYLMECRITDNEILLKVDDIHYGDLYNCAGEYYVDIRIPNVKAGNYTIKYAPMYSEYSGKEQILISSPSTIGRIVKVENKANFFVNGSTILCNSSTAVKMEVYTMDAVKVGEASFINGEAMVKVNKTPAIYLYIVTYPDGRRESGKVGVK